jgi:protein ImuA
MGTSRSEVLATLRASFAAHQQPQTVVRTGWTQVDRALPRNGLARKRLHEWLGIDEAVRAGRAPEFPLPISLLVHLVRRACLEQQAATAVYWIGERTWPYPIVLGSRSDPAALVRSVFVRAPDRDTRLWAADLAFRSSGACAVVADGSGFSLAATRRLQLAAEAGNSLCLLARPAAERTTLSAAATRWLVRSSSSATRAKRWTVQLLRSKEMSSAPGELHAWVLEQRHATNLIDLVSDVLDGCGATEIATRGRRTA